MRLERECWGEGQYMSPEFHPQRLFEQTPPLTMNLVVTESSTQLTECPMPLLGRTEGPITISR